MDQLRRSAYFLTLALTLWVGEAQSAAIGFTMADSAFVGNARPVTSGGAPTYLVNQNFEGTGYDNSETWTEQANPDEDYTTSPAPLEGSQSLYFNGTTQRATSPTIAQDEIYWYGMVNFTTFPSCSPWVVLGPNFTVDLNVSGVLRVGGSLNSSFTTDAMSTGVTYHYRIRYVKGSGSNARASFEFSTTSTFVGSGNKFTEFTTGTETQQATNVRLSGEAGSTVTFVADKIRVDDVAINGL